MFQAHHHFRLRRGDSDPSAVEGADPLHLVQILFDELIVSLDLGERSIRAGDERRKSAHLSRALSILDALEHSLDHEAGGPVASGLAEIYRFARRELGAAIARSSVDHLRAAAEPLVEIATAWRMATDR
jgi:flagellar protein FliS